MSEPGPVPRTGDRYSWRGIRIEIREVDPEGLWANIHCVIPEREDGALRKAVHEWDKQQPTPGGTLPADWLPLTTD